VLLRRSTVADEAPGAHAPGTIAAIEADAIRIAANPGSLELLEIQPEGRPPMTVRAYLSGHPVQVGQRFEPLDDTP
jgi:methionyl-tRNA formyltransferase